MFLKKAGMAAVSASALSMLLTGRTFAAPGSSTPRYLVDQIDAKTLVVTDALSGAYWLGLDPAWYYEINPTMAMFAIYDQLYAGQDGSESDQHPAIAGRRNANPQRRPADRDDQAASKASSSRTPAMR